jgi:GST-like protein
MEIYVIEVYTGSSPNVYKVLIALNEMGILFTTSPVNVLAGEQFSEAFLNIAPNNKIPAIVDHNPDDGLKPFAVFESGAILLYLAEKSKSFVARDVVGRSTAIQWLFWQMANFGPMLGQAHYFLHYASEPVPHAVRRYRREVSRLYGVLEKRLAGSRMIAGDDYSIADMAIWPWVYYRVLHEIDLDDYTNVARWFEEIAARPAVIAAMNGLEINDAKLPEDARRVVFGE